MIKKLLPLSIIFLSSCAIKPIYNTQLEADKMINQYKDQSVKQELSDAIDEKPIHDKMQFLKPVVTQQTKKWIEYFSKKDKARFERFLTRGSKYKTLIQKILKEQNLPEDLFYVGLIESGYTLSAKSRASAVGPWQFIKSTGLRYGLKINSKVDERRHIVKATYAAARYFKDLYNIFGSWELALSAYNAGEFGVIKRIRKADTRDFYQLSEMKKLPKETRNYVPKVVAAMEIAKNLNKYGVNLKKENSPFQSTLKTIELKKYTYSLRDIAKKSMITLKTLKELNNDLNGDITPRYKKSSHRLYIPSAMPVKLASFSKKKSRSISSTGTKTHKVRSGENLYLIARKYKVKISRIKKLNKMRNSRIYPGQRLIVN